MRSQQKSQKSLPGISQTRSRYDQDNLNQQKSQNILPQMTQPLFNSPQNSRDNMEEARPSLPITLSFGDLTIDMDQREGSVLSSRQKQYSMNTTQKPTIRKIKALAKIFKPKMQKINGSGLSPIQDALKTVSLNPNMSDELLLQTQAAMERSSDDLNRVNNMNQRSRINKFL